ncbi:ADP-ribosylation factor-binding protein Gga isoform X1 [Brevipalpus obovatus]|uniref:ADP-ribosylation factor-binding protein Gga isoform X1 n=1 Tax=Brevipalpus obovatus TaxID=246614 RepID=UPI003D9EAD44
MVMSCLRLSKVSGHSLDIRLAQTTNPLVDEIDPQAIEDLMSYMCNNKESICIVLRFLGHKIQSPQEFEAQKALRVLQALVNKGDPKFIEEVGKNRFLNELIKVISPKYLGQRSSDSVKQKIIELLYLWTIEFKHETKIFEAYQMLKRQGLISQDPVYVAPHIKPLSPPPPRPKDEIWDNEENALTLRRLIHSGNPHDLIAANKLIKALASQAERKSEAKHRCVNDMELARNNAQLLAEVLANYSGSQSSTSSELELINELRESCEKLRPKLFKAVGEMDDKDPLLDEVLLVSDSVCKVLIDCKAKLNASKSIGEKSSEDRSHAVGDLLGVGTISVSKTSESAVSSATSSQTSSFINDVSLLCDHYLTDTPQRGNSLSNSSHNTGGVISPRADFLDNGCLEKSNDTQHGSVASESSKMISENGSKSEQSDTLTIINTNGNSNLNSPRRNIPSLNELENMMRLTLNESPKVPETGNISLNALKNKTDDSQGSALNVIKSIMLSNHYDAPQNGFNQTSASCISSPKSLTTESIIDIFVPLESIEPSNRAPLLLVEENGLKSLLHFGKNSPREDIIVAVLTTTNNSSHSISKIFFHLDPPKHIRVKLQAPSGTSLNPSSPFFPPSAITQVVLIAKSAFNSSSDPAGGDIEYKLDYFANSINHSKTGSFSI